MSVFRKVFGHVKYVSGIVLALEWQSVVQDPFEESITDVGDSNLEDLLCAALLMERKLRKMLRATNTRCLH